MCIRTLPAVLLPSGAVLLDFDLIIVLRSISLTEDEEDEPEQQSFIKYRNEESDESSDGEEDAQKTRPYSKGRSSTTKKVVKSTSTSKNFRSSSGKSTSKRKKRTPDPEEDPGTETECEESVQYSPVHTGPTRKINGYY